MGDSKDIDDIPDEADVMALRPGRIHAGITRKSITKGMAEKWEVLLFIAEAGGIQTITSGESYSSSEIALWHASRRAKSMFRSTGKHIDFGARLQPVKH